MSHAATAIVSHTRPKGRRIIMRMVALVLAASLLWAPILGAKAFDEAAVKAVFLFRLALFVTWPEPTASSAMSSTDTPFIIGIYGADPFAGRLKAVVRGERMGRQAIVVRHYASPNEIAAQPCQLLYIGDLTAIEDVLILADLALRHKILTVGDGPSFAHEGGMIAIETVAKRIHITINLAATRQAGFSISAKLLKIAKLISSEAP